MGWFRGGQNLFFLLYTKQMVSIMLGENATSQLDSIPLSNDTLTRCIHTVWLLMSTSVAQMLTYIRSENDGNLEEEFLFCQPLLQCSTGEQLFAVLHGFVFHAGLESLCCVGDSARAITGKNSR